jgi:hypothetical protein
VIAGQIARRAAAATPAAIAAASAARARAVATAVMATGDPTSSGTGVVLAARIETGASEGPAGSGPRGGSGRIGTTASRPATEGRVAGTDPVGTSAVAVTTGAASEALGVGRTVRAHATIAPAASVARTAGDDPPTAVTRGTTVPVAIGAHGRTAATSGVVAMTAQRVSGGPGRTAETRGVAGTTAPVVTGGRGWTVGTSVAVGTTVLVASGGRGWTAGTRAVHATTAPVATAGGRTARSRGGGRTSGSGAIDVRRRVGVVIARVRRSADTERLSAPTAVRAGATSPGTGVTGARTVESTPDRAAAAGSPMPGSGRSVAATGRRPGDSGPTAQRRRPARRCPSRP